MWINKERTGDMRRGWQSSMKATAGSDILHKPGDASGMMEAASRVKRDTARRGEKGGGVQGGVRYCGFCLQIPVLISSVPHSRPPASLAAWSWRLVPAQKKRVSNVWEEKPGQDKRQKGRRPGGHVWRWADPSVRLQPRSQWGKRQWSKANGNSGGAGEGWASPVTRHKSCSKPLTPACHKSGDAGQRHRVWRPNREVKKAQTHSQQDATNSSLSVQAALITAWDRLST